MKSSFLFIRFCVLISILASGALIFLLLRAIYYPQLSVLLLLIILLCHLVTTEYKRNHPSQVQTPVTPQPFSIPADARKALASALGGVSALTANEKTKLSASERKQLILTREALLTIAHFFESTESMRGNRTPLLENPHEVTSLTETVIRVVDNRRATFLKKGIVLMYRTTKLDNEYIAIDQKHLKRIIETLLKIVAERNIRGKVTLTQSELLKVRTVSLDIKVSARGTANSEQSPSVRNAQYTTLKRLIEHYGGTIAFNTEDAAAWTNCTCTFPSHR